MCFFASLNTAPEQAGRKVHEQAWTGGQEQHTRASTELTPRTRRNGDGRKGTQGGDHRDGMGGS